MGAGGSHRGLRGKLRRVGSSLGSPDLLTIRGRNVKRGRACKKKPAEYNRANPAAHVVMRGRRGGGEAGGRESRLHSLIIWGNLIKRHTHTPKTTPDNFLGSNRRRAHRDSQAGRVQSSPDGGGVRVNGGPVGGRGWAEGAGSVGRWGPGGKGHLRRASRATTWSSNSIRMRVWLGRFSCSCGVEWATGRPLAPVAWNRSQHASAAEAIHHPTPSHTHLPWYGASHIPPNPHEP